MRKSTRYCRELKLGNRDIYGKSLYTDFAILSRMRKLKYVAIKTGWKYFWKNEPTAEMQRRVVSYMSHASYSRASVAAPIRQLSS